MFGWALPSAVPLVMASAGPAKRAMPRAVARARVVRRSTRWSFRREVRFGSPERPPDGRPVEASPPAGLTQFRYASADRTDGQERVPLIASFRAKRRLVPVQLSAQSRAPSGGRAQNLSAAAGEPVGGSVDPPPRGVGDAGQGAGPPSDAVLREQERPEPLRPGPVARGGPGHRADVADQLRWSPARSRVPRAFEGGDDVADRLVGAGVEEGLADVVLTPLAQGAAAAGSGHAEVAEPGHQLVPLRLGQLAGAGGSGTTSPVDEERREGQDEASEQTQNDRDEEQVPRLAQPFAHAVSDRGRGGRGQPVDLGSSRVTVGARHRTGGPGVGRRRRRRPG